MNRFKIAFAIASTSFILASCVTQPTIVERTTVVELKVPVPVKCIERLPPAPRLEPIPKTGVTDQTLARISREEELRIYSNELKILATPCVESKGDDNAASKTHRDIQPAVRLAQ